MASGDTIDDVKKYTQSLMDGLKNAFLTNFDVTAIAQKLKEVEKGATDVAKTFGQGREQITAIKAAMAEAVTSVTLLNGGFQDIVTLQTDIGRTLGTNLILNSQSYEKLFATTQVTGRGATELTKNFKDAGYSVYSIGEQMEKVMNISTSIGVNGRAVSEKVSENMSKMNQFNFQGGVEGLAKMAAQAVNLRVDMNKTLELASGLFEPEKAIDLAAAMQRLGVAQGDLLDPLRLMDLAQNDPAELQNQIAEMSKSFTKLKADGTGFEILPGEKRRLMEISEQLGMGRDGLAKMALAAGDLDLKMSKIKFSDNVTDESTQKLIANMSEMGAGGEYKISYTDKEGKLQEKNVTELDEKDVAAITAASQQAPKTMEDLAKEQLTTSQKMATDINSIANRTGYGLAGTKSVTMAENAGREMSGAVSKFASGKSTSIKGIRENVGGGMDDFIKTLNDGKPMEAFVNAASGTANYMNTVYNEALVKGKEGLNDLANSTNPLIQIMDKIVAKGANLIVDNVKIIENNQIGTNKVTEAKPMKDFVKFPGETVKPLEMDTIIGMTKGRELFDSSIPNNNSNSMTSSIKMEDVNVNLNIKIDAPSNMDNAQLMLAFNDQSVKGALITAFQSALANANGSNGSNPIEARKQMTKLANA
jgi:hypothetical protein